MVTTLTPTLYVVGNINVDLIMSTLSDWPQRGTEVMLQHSELRPGGSAGNCALALEAIEALEQLRVLWHGFPIAVHITASAPEAGVDTPQDLARVQQHFQHQTG